MSRGRLGQNIDVILKAVSDFMDVAGEFFDEMHQGSIDHGEPEEEPEERHAKKEPKTKKEPEEPRGQRDETPETSGGSKQDTTPTPPPNDPTEQSKKKSKDETPPPKTTRTEESTEKTPVKETTETPTTKTEEDPSVAVGKQRVAKVKDLLQQSLAVLKDFESAYRPMFRKIGISWDKCKEKGGEEAGTIVEEWVSLLQEAQEDRQQREKVEARQKKAIDDAVLRMENTKKKVKDWYLKEQDGDYQRLNTALWSAYEVEGNKKGGARDWLRNVQPKANELKLWIQSQFGGEVPSDDDDPTKFGGLTYEAVGEHAKVDVYARLDGSAIKSLHAGSSLSNAQISVYENSMQKGVISGGGTGSDGIKFDNGTWVVKITIRIAAANEMDNTLSPMANEVRHPTTNAIYLNFNQLVYRH